MRISILGALALGLVRVSGLTTGNRCLYSLIIAEYSPNEDRWSERINLGLFEDFTPEKFRHLIWDSGVEALVNTPRENSYCLLLDGCCVPRSGWNMVQVETSDSSATMTSQIIPRIMNNIDYGAGLDYDGEFVYLFRINFTTPITSDTWTDVKVMPLPSLKTIRFDQAMRYPVEIPLLLQGPLNVAPGLVGSVLPSDFPENFGCLLEMWSPVHAPDGATEGEMYIMESEKQALARNTWYLQKNASAAGEGLSLPALECAFRFYARNGQRRVYNFRPKVHGGKTHLYSFASF